MKTPDGAIAYALDGDGEPVLFIQGVGLHGAGWRPQTEALRADFACLSFDHRGVGDSASPVREITVESMAADARALLDAADWKSAHVVGHSLGGLIALRFALDDPARVRSLSLLCTFANGSEAAPPSARMLSLGVGTRLGTRAMRRRAFVQLIVAPLGQSRSELDALAAQFESVFGHDLAEQPAIVTQQLRALRSANVTPRLPALANIPTQVLGATHDLIAPPSLGRAIAAGVPGARFEEFGDAAHGLPITHANAVNDRLRAHVLAASAARGAR